MKKPERHLITCALPYANGPIHIGHIAGCLLPSDIYNRYLQNKGEKTLFVCGTDEHGVPITLKAKKENITPQQVVDRYYDIISNSLKEFGINFDNFSRTTRDIHKKTAMDFFKTLYDNGVFNEEVTEQYFDPVEQQFLADRYITGTCPKCAYELAYGDQCENCGSSLNSRELINPTSALSGEKPILKSTKNWYLPLDKIQEDFLNTYIESHKSDWKSHVYGQCKSWLKDGLKPRAMTRDLDWGVPVPVEGAEGKVMYVWFDAPIGYISATKEIAPDWETWWKDDSTEISHFIGKDNIVFHCLIFPAMLKVHGDYNVPTNVPANEFLNLEGQKISTSRDHAVWLHDYLNDFKGKEDELRYVLASISPENKDADFSWKDYQARVNNELVAIIGNWVNRVLVLSHKYFDGKMDVDLVEHHVLKQANDLKSKADQSMEKFMFRDALSKYVGIARIGNKYLADTEPWKLFKTDPEKVKEILRVSLELIKEFSVVIEPFLPNTSQKIQGLLNLSKSREFAADHVLNKAELLFQKIEDQAIDDQLEKLSNKVAETKVKVEKPTSKPEMKPNIEFEDFSKIDLKTGTILKAAKVKKADRLLELQVDMGFEERTIVSGIAEHYAPEDIIGQQVVVVTNLEPRKLRGIVSQGMILMAEEDGKLVFVAPSEKLNSGSGVS
jgi:methionyl-tRNA synthetase